MNTQLHSYVTYNFLLVKYDLDAVKVLCIGRHALIVLSINCMSFIFLKMPLSTEDLLAVLGSFAEEFLSNAEIVQSDWPSNVSDILSSPLERRKLGFNLTLQVIFSAYVELLEGGSFEAPTPLKQV